MSKVDEFSGSKQQSASEQTNTPLWVYLSRHLIIYSVVSGILYGIFKWLYIFYDPVQYYGSPAFALVLILVLHIFTYRKRKAELLAKYWVRTCWMLIFLSALGGFNQVFAMIATFNSKAEAYNCSKLAKLRQEIPSASNYTNKQIYDAYIAATSPNVDLRTRWAIYQGLWKEDKQNCY